jgi:AmmeMemoRadiSam system protein B
MSVRAPAVAGAFYPASPDELRRQIALCLGPPRDREPALGAVVPHAGYVYSGAVAGALYSRILLPSVVVILCPNHTGFGRPAAVDPHDEWQTPLGRVPVDRELRDRFLAECPSLELDAAAHRREHSLEVQLPFLQAAERPFRFVPISIGAVSLDLCREIGEAAARLASERPEPFLLLASSDMNHYESRDVGNRKNDLALSRILDLDPPGLFETVLAGEITMCGFLPATALLFAARKLGRSRAEIVAAADSGDRTGDVDSVVGYASVLIP